MSGSSTRIRSSLRGGSLALGVVALWEVVGRLHLVADGAFPSLTSVLSQLWRDRADYPPHVAATLRAAVTGFLFGNLVAIVAALLFLVLPWSERLLRGVGVSLFAVPLIAVVPVLLIAFDGTTPRIVLAAMAVYYPTSVATLDGLRRVDARLVDVVHGAGGGDLAVLRWVRVRSAVPAVLAGFRVAAPASLLGALLVEFGGGVRWGLGSYLLASLGRALPERIWGIGLVATVVAAAAYGLFAALGAWAARDVQGPTTATTTGAEVARPGGPVRRALDVVLSAAVVLGLWALVLELLDLSPVVAKGPLGVVRYLLTGERGASARTRLAQALADTLPVSFLGLACGLGAALVLAVLMSLRPSLGRAVLPFALVSQTMPLPALTPIIVLVFGRDVLAMVMVTISVTFFPSFVTILQGIQSAPTGPSDVVRSYGGGKGAVLRLVGLPHAVGHLATAARLAAPRALLGVMISEYLATGTGLGNLLNEARGRLEYGMIWSVAVVSVIVGVLLTAGVGALERAVWRRRRA